MDRSSRLNPFEQVAQRLDLRRAEGKAGRSNDLLPPRLEDKVAGRVGNRLTEFLAHTMDSGTYAPGPAYFIPVPKNSLTSRPAAILTLEDRIVFQALIQELAPRIEEALMDTTVVFWPRATAEGRSWAEFEQAPLAEGPLYVVRADVAAFYESIPHGPLMDLLIKTTGRHDLVEALQEFLGRIMGRAEGLPQGLVPSDVLATLFLTPLDQAMILHEHRYMRRGDDFRIGVDDFQQGRQTVAFLEQELRTLGLHLNGDKTRVLKVETYKLQLESVEKTKREIRDRLGEDRAQRLYEMEEEELQQLAFEELGEEEELEELLWELYRGEADLEEVVAHLTDRIDPSDAEVAEALFRETLDRAPGKDNELGREEFHGRLTSALTILTASRSASVIPQTVEVLVDFPDETRPVVTYLSALASTFPKDVADVVQGFLLSPGYRPPWQEATLISLLLPSSDHLVDDFITYLLNLAANEQANWLVRAQAARLLGRSGKLPRELLRGLWSLSPESLKPDLIAAGAEMAAHESWAEAFVGAAASSPVLEMVAKDVSGPVQDRLRIEKARRTPGTEYFRELRAGDEVFHVNLGIGRILSIENPEDGSATVQFTEDTKHLILKYAPIIKHPQPMPPPASDR
jgi:retron-type reverse transcriptase